jgi:hypothetical protein
MASARAGSLEDGEFGFGSAAIDAGGAAFAPHVRFPMLAGDVQVCFHRRLGRGHQGVGGQRGFGGELAEAGGAAFEALDTFPVFVAVVVGELRGQVAGVAHPLGGSVPSSAAAMPTVQNGMSSWSSSAARGVSPFVGLLSSFGPGRLPSFRLLRNVSVPVKAGTWTSVVDRS